MRRIILPATAILLACACTSQGGGPQPSDRPAAPSTASSKAEKHPGAAATPHGRLTVAIPAAQLPFKPDAGMPALDDVRVIKTAADACAVPSDNSGEQAQLLGATAAGPGTVNVAFSFTNPCPSLRALAAADRRGHLVAEGHRLGARRLAAAPRGRRGRSRRGGRSGKSFPWTSPRI